MKEFEARKLRPQLLPESPHAKVAPSYVCIMKQNHCPLRQFRSPRFEIMTDSFIGVETINVQQINKAVREVGQCLIERTAKELRKGAITLVMKPTKIIVRIFTVAPRLDIPLPGVYSIAS